MLVITLIIVKHIDLSTRRSVFILNHVNSAIVRANHHDSYVPHPCVKQDGEIVEVGGTMSHLPPPLL
jgi:hypothetical protein